MTYAGTMGSWLSRRAVGFAAIGALLLAAVASFGTLATAQSPDEHWILPAAELDPAMSGQQRIVLAGGCFWGIQGVYQHVNGVSSALSGYAGGSEADASYSTVLRGGTGHAESVEVVFNPNVISLAEILRIFFSVAHDPTTLNRQGSDVGPHYRSHIYTTSAAQQEVVNAYIAQLDAAAIYGDPIVTRVDSLPEFFPAEAYHQDYLVDRGRYDPNGPNIRYLEYWDLPKIVNLQNVFPEHYRSDPLTVAETRPELAP